MGPQQSGGSIKNIIDGMSRPMNIGEIRTLTDNLTIIAAESQRQTELLGRILNHLETKCSEEQSEETKGRCKRGG